MSSTRASEAAALAPTSETRRLREAAARAAAAREAPTVLGVGFFALMFSSSPSPAPPSFSSAYSPSSSSATKPEHCSRRASRIAASALEAFRRREASKGSRPERDASVLKFFFSGRGGFLREERKKHWHQKETETPFCFSFSRSPFPLSSLARAWIKKQTAGEPARTQNAPVGNISLTNATASKRSSSKASGFLGRWGRSTPPVMLDGEEAPSFSSTTADSLAFSCCLCCGEAVAASVSISAAERERPKDERAPSSCRVRELFQCLFFSVRVGNAREDEDEKRHNPISLSSLSDECLLSLSPHTSAPSLFLRFISNDEDDGEFSLRLREDSRQSGETE